MHVCVCTMLFKPSLTSCRAEKKEQKEESVGLIVMCNVYVHHHGVVVSVFGIVQG